MLDRDIMMRFDALGDMMSQDIHQLQRGISMLRTRQDAMERLLFKSRFGIVKLVLLQLFSPSMLQRMLTAIHNEEIQRYNENRRKAATAKKIVTAPVPGLVH